jgi:hypothetical protein
MRSSNRNAKQRGRPKGPETIVVHVRIKRKTFNSLHACWHACGAFTTFSAYLRNELDKLAAECSGCGQVGSQTRIWIVVKRK